MSTVNYVYKEGIKFPIKMWTSKVDIEDKAFYQLLNLSSLPFIYSHIAAMPDVHWGMGATVGSVIATKGAIIPAAVGVDIGCGMVAVETTLNANDLPDNLHGLRTEIERLVPHGRTNNGQAGDRGAWHDVPYYISTAANSMEEGLQYFVDTYPKLFKNEIIPPSFDKHLGTLGTGNHFIEICLDEKDSVWVMLHSGSRGIGNRIGTFFIDLAKKDMERWFINLPDKDLAYIPEGSTLFDDYIEAVHWAQDYAELNRSLMLEAVIKALHNTITKPFKTSQHAINCHHNYVAKEHHFNHNVWVTRKGAVRAREGDLGIIPGSMGAKSYIVRGKGNHDSFSSCSHGAGRVMSRTAALNLFTVEDHKKATEGVECRKDKDVVDETPMAYKDIDAVMESQKDLVDIVHTLKQVVCVKG